jgi:hypothetical protein
MSDPTTWQTVPGAYVFRDTAGNVHRVSWTPRTWADDGESVTHALDFRTTFGPSGTLLTGHDDYYPQTANAEAWYDIRTLGDVHVPEVNAPWPIGTPCPLEGVTSRYDATPGDALRFMLTAAHGLADRLPADCGDTYGPGVRAARVTTHSMRMAG